MMSVVTGASGHVGGNLVRALLAEGREVRVLIHHDRRAIEGLDVEVVEGDVCDPASLRRAFAGADIVYHLAVHTSILTTDWPLCEAVNVLGTRNVVEACLACGARRLVHFSSIHALRQEPLDVPVDESRPLVEDSSYPPYDRSKAAAEKEVQKGIERGLDAIIISPTGVIGPYDFRPSHFGEVLLALAGGKMPALIESGFDWVDVRDVVQGALRAEKLAARGARYLLSGHWASMRDLAAMIAEISGVPAPRFASPMWAARLAAPLLTALAQLTRQRPLCTSASLKALCGNPCISHERATRELNYQPRPLRETLADTLRWFADNSYLLM